MKTLSRPLKTVSVMTLFFFCWTLLSLSPIAVWAEEKKQESVKNQKQEKERPEEGFAKAVEAVKERVSKIEEKAAKGEDAASEIESLRGSMAEIESLDTELRKEFTATEKRIKEANLPKEILDRHYKFVKYYEDNLKELKANILAVEKAKTKAEIKTAAIKTKEHLEKIKLPKKHTPLDLNKLPHRPFKAKARQPRLKKEEFEKEFGPQNNRLPSAISRATVPIPKPLLLAANGPLTGLLSELPTYQSENTLLALNTSDSLMSATQNAPTQADIAETIEVQFTDAITAKAQALGSAPNIFAWVRNNIKYEPYYGSLKGAQQTLLEGAGNDFDQASLLISMLRVMNIPARYAYGTVEIPTERVASWLGVTDPIVAGTILTTNGIPAMLVKTSSGVYKTVRLEHCWVAAFVNMYPSFGAKNIQGDTWVPLDPSFKENTVTENIDLSKVVAFNEADYLSSRKDIPPSLSYLFAIEDYHTANYTGKIFDLFYVKQTIEENFEVLLGTLPYQIITASQQFSEVPDSMRHKININLTDPGTGEAVTVQRNIAEVTGRKITVSYNPATQADDSTISYYGGLMKTPAYLVKVKPVVQLDNTVILEGQAVNLGAALQLTVNFIEPGMNMEKIETDISAGIYYVIGLSALQPSQQELSGKLDNLNNLSGTVYDSVNTRDGQIGDLLHDVTIEYFAKVNSAAKSLASVMHIQNTNVTSAGFASVRVAYANVFGVPASPATITGLNMDVQRYMQSPFSTTGDNEQRKKYAQIQGLNSSFFEHRIMEMLTGLESISAVKALQIAGETGIPTYKITGANISDVLPTLTVSQDVKTDIMNAVNAGKEVTILRDNVQLNNWRGMGYIVRDTATGAGAYMISGASAGVDTTQPPSALLLLGRRLAAFAQGQPSSTWLDPRSWEMYPIASLFMDSIGSMVLSRGYIPKIEDTFTKQALIDHANNAENWIFYYNGHGGVIENSSINYLAPLPPFFGNGGELVYPSEIHADNKITFLNACYTATYLGFMGSFGIDQKLNGDPNHPRDEVFLGWDDKVLWVDGEDLGFNWWRNMYDGDTAEDAAINLNSEYTNYQNTIGLKLIIKGNIQTKL